MYPLKNWWLENNMLPFQGKIAYIFPGVKYSIRLSNDFLSYNCCIAELWIPLSVGEIVYEPKLKLRVETTPM